MRVLGIVFLLTCFSQGLIGQWSPHANELAGVYQSKKDKFERYSIITLKDNGQFTYEYGLGGCQGKVKGSWKVVGREVQFKNDSEFSKNSTIVYPDMSKTNWRATKIGIKPIAPVNSGCLEVAGTHLKSTVVSSREYTVSIIQLISNPEKYHNKRVQVKGYLNLEFEGNAIYLHKDDFKNGISKNALWLTFSDKLTTSQFKKLNHKYVLISGTFNMDHLGHMGLFSGTIESIETVQRNW